MGADWPVREVELREIERFLALGVSVLAVGGPGVGKSTLLGAALDRAARAGAHIVRPDALTDPRRLVRGPRRRVVVAADDLAAADPGALATACRLVSEGQALLLASASPADPLPEALRRLLIGGLVRRVTVEPFGRSETAAVLRALLGGPVDTATAERFWQLSRGNALVLRELADHAVAAGALTPVRGNWHWPGLTGAPDSRLTDLAGLLLGELDPAERELVGFLALAGSLDAGLPLVADARDAAEALDRRGVIVTERRGFQLTLRLAHPLCEAVVPWLLPELTARRMRAQLADALEAAGGRRPGELLRAATLRLATGTAPRRDHLEPAAAEALAHHDFALAERLCRAALTEGRAPTPSLALLLGRALAGQGRHAEAEDHFRDAAGAQSGPEARTALLGARAVNLALGLHRPADAAALVDAAVRDTAARRGADPADGHAAGADPDSATGADAVRAAGADPVPAGYRDVHALTRLFTDRLHETAAYASEPAPPAGLPALALARHEQGDSDGALALLGGGPAPSGEDRDPAAHLDRLAVLGWITLQSRGEAEALAVLDALREAARNGSPRHEAHLSLLEARVHRSAGRTAKAVELLRHAAAREAPGDWVAPRASRLAELAGALAELGETAEALCLLDDAKAAREAEYAYPLVADAVALERAVVAVRLGDRPAAVRRALGVAERAAAGGRRAQALTALHLAARAGDPARAAALLDGGPGGVPVRGSVPEARARHVRALADDDGDALDEVSTRFAALGLLPLAAEAATQAALAHQRARDRRKVRASRAAGARLGAHCDTRPASGAAAPERGRGRRAAAHLTSREREVVALAAAHLTNQEIADRLVLSVRTVENHLYRAYGKLGVTARSELARRLGAVPLHDRRIA
ncbi:LuxR C-terminal-related transcriptional regulator [Streptomyces sp. NPDC050585]|uniref:helix-turn-helix transcriptional regulator n=1 Tax=Streptomyces sp. NPDC050585 TaxID=3365632 RepID=UPI0037B9B607